MSIELIVLAIWSLIAIISFPFAYGNAKDDDDFNYEEIDEEGE